MDDEEARRIVGGDADAIVACAQRVAREMRGEVRNSQVRNVYGALVRIKEGCIRDGKHDPTEQWRQLKLLRPKLAYMKARQNRTAPLEVALREVIEAIRGDQLGSELRHVFEFAEAIVAYSATGRG
jgi:CRISPR type III-A-associated protein Csm2